MRFTSYDLCSSEVLDIYVNGHLRKYIVESLYRGQHQVPVCTLVDRSFVGVAQDEASG